MRTRVYIDGFNLYYGCLKGTPAKWLNPALLCDNLLPKNKIEHVRYFTATVSARPNDPDQTSRQQTISGRGAGRAQFPQQMTDKVGTFTKPARW